MVEVEVASAEPAGVHGYPDHAGAAGRDGNLLQADSSIVSDDGGAHRPFAARAHPRSSRSITARTITGQAMVASEWTSTCRPPSLSGTNFPHETPSV